VDCSASQSSASGVCGDDRGAATHGSLVGQFTHGIRGASTEMLNVFERQKVAIKQFAVAQTVFGGSREVTYGNRLKRHTLSRCREFSDTRPDESRLAGPRGAVQHKRVGRRALCGANGSTERSHGTHGNAVFRKHQKITPARRRRGFGECFIRERFRRPRSGVHSISILPILGRLVKANRSAQTPEIPAFSCDLAGFWKAWEEMPISGLTKPRFPTLVSV
jgi:hypothetical protein